MPVNSHVVRQWKSFLISLLLLGVSSLSSPDQAEQLLLVEKLFCAFCNFHLDFCFRIKLLCRCQCLRWEPGVGSCWGPGLVVRNGLSALCCWFLCCSKKGISVKSEVLRNDFMADNWFLCSFSLLTGRSMRSSPTWGAWRPQTRSQCTVSDEGAWVSLHL